MSTAQTTANKAAYRRYLDVGNSGDAELISKAIDEVFEPDVVIHRRLPFEATGAQALKQVWVMLLRTFPDIHMAVEDLIAEGDKVVARNSVTGTNHGEYLGRPPTGKPVTYDEIFIYRFTNGRIAEMWGIVDVLPHMKQLGITPV